MPVTKPEQKSLFSVGEVCEILKACREFGVGQLRIGDMEVWLGHKYDSPGPTSPEQLRVIVKEQEAAAKDALLKDELRLKDAQLSQAWLENPSLAEEMLERGELEELDGADDDEET